MCDATTLAIAQLGFAGASSIAEYKAGQDEAAATRAAATKNLQLTYKDLGTRQLEEIQSATQQKNEITRTVAESQGSARAGAAGAGVSGISVDLLLGDLSRQGANAKDSVQQNTESAVAQLERQKLSARAQARSQINSAAPPSFIPTALRLGSSALQAYSDIRLS